MEAMGIAVTHVYGLTETYGPCVLCEPQQSWQGQDATTLSRLKARQGGLTPQGRCGSSTRSAASRFPMARPWGNRAAWQCGDEGLSQESFCQR